MTSSFFKRGNQDAEREVKLTNSHNRKGAKLRFKPGGAGPRAHALHLPSTYLAPDTLPP